MATHLCSSPQLQAGFIQIMKNMTSCFIPALQCERKAGNIKRDVSGTSTSASVSVSQCLWKREEAVCVGECVYPASRPLLYCESHQHIPAVPLPLFTPRVPSNTARPQVTHTGDSIRDKISDVGPCGAQRLEMSLNSKQRRIFIHEICCQLWCIGQNRF